MTTNCTNNRLSVLSSVLSVVSCYALRPKSLSMPYSCRAYLSTAAQPCKVGRDEYDRMDIENGNTTLKQKNPAVEILLSIRRTRPCQGRQAAVVPLHDKKRHQELCVRRLCLQRLQACFLRQSDRWQIVALDEQHYRACEF
ncbi:hypothetical protein, partial [Prevotella jejuni]|uniref:hypothetical protein n=1 Tax=Prevotella jejuni TaxID=1177574 RepID=UPI0028EE02E2